MPKYRSVNGEWEVVEVSETEIKKTIVVDEPKEEVKEEPKVEEKPVVEEKVVEIKPEPKKVTRKKKSTKSKS